MRVQIPHLVRKRPSYLRQNSRLKGITPGTRRARYFGRRGPSWARSRPNGCRIGVGGTQVSIWSPSRRIFIKFRLIGGQMADCAIKWPGKIALADNNLRTKWRPNELNCGQMEAKCRPNAGQMQAKCRRNAGEMVRRTANCWHNGRDVSVLLLRYY